MWSYIGSAQPAFDFRYHHGMDWSNCWVTAEADSSYVMSGEALNRDTTFAQGIYFTEIDKKTGELISSLYWVIPAERLLYRTVNDAYLINDTLFTCVIREQTAYLIGYATLGEPSVSIVDSILFSDHDTTSMFITELKMHEGDFYLVTDYNLNESATTTAGIYVAKFDHCGFPECNVIAYSPGYNISIGAVSIGQKHIDMFYRSDGNIKAIRCNHNGDILWNYTFSPEFDLHIPAQIHSEDSNRILLIGGATKINFGGYDPFALLFDRAKEEVVWIKRYTTNGPGANLFRDLVKVEDKNEYIMCGNIGEYFDTFSTRFGMLVRLDIEGEEIWKRKYLGVPDSLSSNFFYDIEPTSDGQYLVSGYSRYYNEPAEFRDWANSWVIKINDDGDIVPIDTTTTVLEPIGEKSTDQIRVYPNPVTDLLYINQDYVTDVRYEIFDMQGQKVDEVRLKSAFLSTTWDVSHIAAGQYLLRMSDKTGLLGQVKFSKI